MKRYYKVIGVITYPNGWKEYYQLGYTSNKQAFQRGTGWKMKDLIFQLKYRKEQSC